MDYLKDFLAAIASYLKK